jgi:DNA-binding CsgD family transcriptional regulator
VGQAHLRLGRLARRDGATRRAADHFGQSLRAYRETGIVTQAGLPLAELGHLLVDNGYRAAASRIAGMIQAISDRTGAAFDGGWAFTQPRGQMAPSFAMAEFASGRSLPFNDALAEAIAVADALAAGSQPPGETRVQPSHAPVALSVRERDVLALLAQRYTAPEMADQLFLSVRTIERHVANIYNKLGVNSRRAAASAAARHGLV